MVFSKYRAHRIGHGFKECGVVIEMDCSALSGTQGSIGQIGNDELDTLEFFYRLGVQMKLIGEAGREASRKVMRYRIVARRTQNYLRKGLAILNRVHANHLGWDKVRTTGKLIGVYVLRIVLLRRIACSTRFREKAQ
jgi:hypothetical protein